MYIGNMAISGVQSMSLNSYTTIIWDWNGTLIDDVALCASLVSRALAARGIGPVSVEQYRAVYQHPIKNVYTELGAPLTDAEYHELTQTWLEQYELERVACSLHSGVEKILSTLQRSRKQQILLSAHRHDLVLAAVSDFKLGDYFEKIAGIESGGGHGKIETGKRILTELQIEPQSTLFIGDSFHDHEVAFEIGAACHLIAQGADARDKLERTGRPVYNTLEEWAVSAGLGM